MSTHYIDPARANEPYYLPTLWVVRFGFSSDAVDAVNLFQGPPPEANAAGVIEGGDYQGETYEDARAMFEREARECPCDQADGGDLDDHGPDCAGWYVCVCIPGCLPDSSWHGPFATEEAAVAKGRAFFGEE